ncbi:DUF4124 domain-containing protein [Thermomonas hydrothermalis]
MRMRAMHHARLLPYLLLSLTVPVQAGQLYRCLDRANGVTYQSQPCAHGQRTDRVIAYTPDPPVVPTARADNPGAHTAHPRAARTGSSLRPIRLRHAPTRLTTAADRCRAAHAKRQAALERLGLRRTFAQLSRLDAQVRAVCGG